MAASIDLIDGLEKVLSESPSYQAGTVDVGEAVLLGKIG